MLIKNFIYRLSPLTPEPFHFFHKFMLADTTLPVKEIDDDFR
jgi:hypothetical protein